MSWNPTQCACVNAIQTLASEWGKCALRGNGTVLVVLCLSGLALSTIEQSPAVAQISSGQIAQVPGGSSREPQYTVLFVNPTSGSDAGTGSEQAPFKTITQALRVVLPNTIILLAPGTYSAETGETFPLYLKPGTTIKGNPSDRGQSIIIKGGGVFLSRTFARQNVTIVGANQAGLTGVTVTNASSQGYGLWIESTSPVITDNTFTGSDHDGASVVGSSAPILRNNYFYQNGANGITIYGTSRPEIQENIFEKTGFGINIAQNAAPQIVGNRVTQNKDGIVIQGRAQPTLRGNVVDSNSRDGMVAIAQSRPNLGTAADPGNNTFMGNGQMDINAKTSSETIVTFGNQLSSNKTNGKLDFSGTANVANRPPTSIAASVPFGQGSPRAPRLPQLALDRSPAQPTSVGLIPVPVGRSTQSSNSGIAPERQPAPVFSRPAATSARRLPAPKTPSSPAAPLVSSPAPLLVAPSRPALFNRLPSASQGIEIPVPAPESGSVAVAPSVRQPLELIPSAASQGILPVPSADAPIGNVGDMSSVPVWRSSAQQTADSPPTPPSQAMAIRYRVVVEAENVSQQSQVRAIVPDAFAVVFRGRTMMQVGAFGDRAKADELLQSLLGQGLRAAIEQL